jgi:hypothetical protein
MSLWLWPLVDRSLRKASPPAPSAQLHKLVRERCQGGSALTISWLDSHARPLGAERQAALDCLGEQGEQP